MGSKWLLVFSPWWIVNCGVRSPKRSDSNGCDNHVLVTVQHPFSAVVDLVSQSVSQSVSLIFGLAGSVSRSVSELGSSDCFLINSVRRFVLPFVFLGTGSWI